MDNKQARMFLESLRKDDTIDIDMMKIERVEFAQRIGNIVIVQLKDKNGKFRNHYHRYKTEEKAEYMFQTKWNDINERN